MRREAVSQELQLVALPKGEWTRRAISVCSVNN